MSGKLVWYGAALAGTGLMATLGVFVRQVSPGNEFTITLGRFGVGLVCLLALRAWARPDERRPMRMSRALAASGILMPLFVVCYVKAVLSGPLANAAFLLYLGPLIASSLAAVWLGEGLSRKSAALLGGALLGTVFITEFRLPLGRAQAESLIFGVLSGLFYGLFLLVNNSKVQDGGGFGRIAPQFLVATVVMLPLVALTGVHVTASDALWITAIGVVHGFVALTLVIAALGHLKTVEYSTISYGEPVAAALIGVFAYQESLSVLQLIGCTLVLIAGVARVLIAEGSPIPEAHEAA